MTVPPNEVSGGFDPCMRIRRIFRKYAVNTEEAFRSPLPKSGSSLSENLHWLSVGVSHVSAPDDFTDLAQNLEAMCRRAENKKLHCWTMSQLERFKSSPVPKLQLFDVVRQWAIRVIPGNLLGGDRKRDRFLKNFRCLLGGGMKAFIPLGALLVGMIPENISVKEQQILAKLVLWLSTRFLWRFVTCFFHVTDVSYGRNEYFVFRKRHWQALMDAGLRQRMNSGHIRPVLTEAGIQTVLGREHAPRQTYVRFLPKRSGARLIGCKARLFKNTAAVDNPARDADDGLLLGHVKRRYLEIVDARGTQLHQRWAKFVAAVGKEERVYVVCADIKDAFDSVDLHRLKAILDSIVRHQSQPWMVLTRVRYRLKGSSGLYTKVSVSTSKEVPKLPPSAVYVSHKQEVLDAKERLKAVAQRSLLHTLSLRVGCKTKHFLRLRGLAQGDCLSTHLCDIYYGYMVKRCILPTLTATTGPRPETGVAATEQERDPLGHDDAARRSAPSGQEEPGVTGENIPEPTVSSDGHAPRDPAGSMMLREAMDVTAGLDRLQGEGAEEGEEKEKEEVAPKLHHRLFVRGIDDFILATTDEHEARRFLQLMETGFPSYGCVINSAKTLTNLPSSPSSSEVGVPQALSRPPPLLSHCGALIDADTRQVRPDFSPYFGKNIAHAMSFPFNNAPLHEVVLQKCVFLSTFKLDPLFLDESYNARRTVLENLAECFFVCGLRVHAVMGVTHFGRGSAPGQDVVKNIIDRSLESIMRRLFRKKMAYHSTLERSEVTWLYLEAVGRTLRRSRDRFAPGALDFMREYACRSGVSKQGMVELGAVLQVLRTRKTDTIRSETLDKLR